jgi:hypothetical protein
MSIDQLTNPGAADISPLSPTSQVREINEFIFETIRPYLKGRILEMGSGLDTVSSLLIENGIALHLGETNSQIREGLHEKFDNNPTVRSIHKIDFHRADFEQVYTNILGAFNVVFNLNILNHPIDTQAVANAKLLLKKQGFLIILIPVVTSTFNDLSVDLKELKKYNRRNINSLLGDSFEILKTSYFNLPKIANSTTYSQAGLSVIVVAEKKEIAAAL